ncbi:hypothetical protein [Hyphomicrobium sp. 99]|uniref:hypothetical protein n=1 Tax=Hyphomicrobium sp. 99 TaxID=1163419 RepID=UPI0005F7F6C6|nr:hypothetical protein [Hyphomicrobium sp. 99]
MSGNAADLVVGEIIEIKYRIPLRAFEDSGEPCLSDRWFVAEVIYQDHDTPPMARLADGQFTDIRPFMTWRRIAGRGGRDFATTRAQAQR